MTYLKIGATISIIWALSSIVANAKSEDIPPGILQQDWVSLSDNSGLAVKKVEEAAKGEPGMVIGSIYIKKVSSAALRQLTTE